MYISETWGRRILMSWTDEEQKKKHSMQFLVQIRLGQQGVPTSTSNLLRIPSFTLRCSGLICRRKRQVCFQKNKSQLPHKHCVYWLYLEIHLFCPFGSSVGIFKNFLVQIHDLNKNQNNKIKRIPVSIWNFFQKTYQTGLSFLSSWVYSNPRGYRKNYLFVKSNTISKSWLWDGKCSKIVWPWKGPLGCIREIALRRAVVLKKV